MVVKKEYQLRMRLCICIILRVALLKQVHKLKENRDCKVYLNKMKILEIILLHLRSLCNRYQRYILIWQHIDTISTYVS